MAAQEQEDVKLNRERWRLLQAELPPQRWVFIDESAITTHMTRLYGRATFGARCLDKAPRVRRGLISLSGAIRSEGRSVCRVIEGSVNALVYRTYIKGCLLPTLREGDGVIVDNLSVHKDQESRKLIESVGASLLFLPAYSPDLNPIEMVWSKVKAFLKAFKARTQEALESAVGVALDTITSKDTMGWFAACGYVTSH